MFVAFAQRMFNCGCSTGGLWMKGALVGKVCLPVKISRKNKHAQVLISPPHTANPALRMLCVQRHAGRRPSALPPARAPPLPPSPCTAQEAAIFGALANFTHHGMIFVPVGYRFTLKPSQHIRATHHRCCIAVGTLQPRTCIHSPPPYAAAWRSSPTWKRFTAPVHGAQVQPLPATHCNLPPTHLIPSLSLAFHNRIKLHAGH